MFFFVSGFLISKSYEHNPDIKQYARNRALRIYPALITCILLSLTSVYFTGYFDTVSINPIEGGLWVLGQVSFVQIYNPEFMRGFGTGVLNGALWTITVELQFYIITPIIYKVLKIGSGDRKNKQLIILIAIFMVINMARFSALEQLEDVFLYKLFSVTFIPWLYMFLVGVFFQRNFQTIANYIKNKLPIILASYILVSIAITELFDWRFGNGIAPPLFIFLCVTVLCLAYTKPSLGKSTLQGNDISYGIYIYHIPIVNIIMYYGYGTSLSSALVAVTASTVLALLSWFLVERKFIGLKRAPLNPIQ